MINLNLTWLKFDGFGLKEVKFNVKIAKNALAGRLGFLNVCLLNPCPSLAVYKIPAFLRLKFARLFLLSL